MIKLTNIPVSAAYLLFRWNV